MKKNIYSRLLCFHTLQQVRLFSRSLQFIFLILDRLDEKQKAFGIAVLWAVTQGIGGVAGNLLSGFIIDFYGFYVLFGVISGLCTFALLLNCFSGEKEQAVYGFVSNKETAGN